jgi:cell division protein ZapA
VGAGCSFALVPTERRSVEVRIGGQNVRLVSSASDEELRRLAGVVNEKLGELAPPGRAMPPQALVLAAMALAHDLESERAHRERLERRTRDLMRRLLVRIDDALDAQAPADEDADEAGPG